jgi:hypothetical protein
VTAAEMLTMLRRQAGNPSTTQVPDATLLLHINQAYKDIVATYNFVGMRATATITTVASTASYAIGATVGAVTKVWNATDGGQGRLTKLDDLAYADLTDTDVEGEPVSYYREGSNIFLVPTPDDVYTIKYKYKVIPADISGSTSPSIPTAWHRSGIVTLARHYYFDDLGDTAKAQAALSIHQLFAQNTATDLEDEKLDLDSGVRVPTLSNNARRLDFDHSD